MFEKILGNDIIKNTLEQAIKNSTISHSYLFIGIEGIGKKLIAIEFAKKILETKLENHPDFLIVEPDGNSLKIEQIRELQKKIQEKPIRSNKKVYIINDADKMTKEAQNCLLKTLEEPPSFASLILIGSNESSFLTTIKSRCMILHFLPISDEEMKSYLEKNYGMQGISKNVLDLFQGSIGKAILLKDKQEEYKNLENMVEDLNRKDLIDTLKSAEVLYQSKDEILEMLEYINIILLKKARENTRYVNCVKFVEEAKRKLKQNANYDMVLDDMVFHLWEEVN